MNESFIAYCGPAATPDDLLTRWNFDPPLLFALVVLGMVATGRRSANSGAGLAATLLAVVIFVSPLCALSAALFSARVFHHVLLIAALAPLLALAFPAARWPTPPLALLVGINAVILWVWHLPAAYEWGVGSVPTYWLMQVTLLGSAWLLWRAVLATGRDTGPALLALVLTVAQMGLLAALIVFSPRPLYPVHVAGALSWGLNPLTDQQLAGLLMWVPASLPYLAVALWLAWTQLRPAEPVR